MPRRRSNIGCSTYFTEDRHTNTHTETKSKYFYGHGRPFQSEENKCIWAHDKDGVTRVFERCHHGVARGMDGGKFKRRLSEVNARAVSRGQNELVCKFTMAAGDLVSIRGQVMEYTYIPIGIKRELVWTATGRGKSSGLLEEDRWPFILVGRLSSLSIGNHRPYFYTYFPHNNLLLHHITLKQRIVTNILVKIFNKHR